MHISLKGTFFAVYCRSFPFACKEHKKKEWLLWMLLMDPYPFLYLGEREGVRRAKVASLVDDILRNRRMECWRIEERCSCWADLDPERRHL